MRFAVAVLLALVLFGCTGQQADDGAGDASPQAWIQEPHQPLPNTANLTFYRDASDVFNSETVIPDPPVFDFNTTDADGRLMVYYFYLPKCSACLAITPEIDRMEAEYQDAVFVRYDISSQNGSLAYDAFAGRFNLSSDKLFVPQALVNGTVITDRFNINKSLEGIIVSFSPG
ncbi:MAG: thioredoxin family protein [Candidatus Micrarchaeota archaeon]